jgi:ABC-2 type transport system permease protein
MNIKRELSAIVMLAYRDLIRFLKDRPRLLISFIFPVLFVGVLGGSLQSNLGSDIGFNFMAFVFTGVLGQTLFQSTASGIISLIEDRENNFSQEIFVSPISRYSIIVGKIFGESLVSFAQWIGIVLFGLLIGVPFTFAQIMTLIPAGIIVCLFGGAFGVLVLANLSGQRAANQIFPLIIFPQYFLAGVFNPIHHLPPLLLVLSRISPMTYALDFVRGIFYWGTPDYDKVVLFHPLLNLLVISVMFVLFLVVGTYLFMRNERNR